MYVSGSINDLEMRLHQLPTGLNEVAQYRAEATGLLTQSGITPQLSGKWTDEVNLQNYRLSQNPSYLTGHLV